MIKQITVKAGDGVRVKNEQQFNNAITRFVHAGFRGHKSTKWDQHPGSEELLLINRMNILLWGESGFVNREITLHDLRHATNVVTSQEQALIDDGFTLWDGGECPVDDDVQVDVVHRDGERFQCIKPINGGPVTRWNHESRAGDIIAYRLHQQSEDDEGAKALDDSIAESEADYLANREQHMTPDDNTPQSKLRQAKQLLLKAAKELNCDVFVEYAAGEKDLTVETTTVIVEKY